jgi:protein-disulfide isomerase
MRIKLILALIFVSVISILSFVVASSGNQLNKTQEKIDQTQEINHQTDKSEDSNINSDHKVSGNSEEIKSETSDHSNEGKFYESDIVQGNRDSKIVIIEYFALTCPHCAYFHKNIYPKIKEKYIDTKKIAFIHREFVASKPDFYAAILARCAGNMRRNIFYDLLLERQESWAFNRNFEEILTNIGQLGGITAEQYKSCIEDEKIGNEIMANGKLITRTRGFVGTPVFIINNKIHQGSFAYEELSKIIDNLLEYNEK